MRFKTVMGMAMLAVIATSGSAFAQEGGCCLGDGTCIDTNMGWGGSFECPYIRHGEYLGDGIFCGQQPCPPVETCCMGDGTCQMWTRNYCESNGGTYMGGGGTCADVSCPLTGACCSGIDATCQMVTRHYCSSILAGTFYGEEVPCEGLTCPTGACCSWQYATCTEGKTAWYCRNQVGGTYMGDGTTCATTTCPALGACCDPAYGTCREVAAELCTLWRNQFQGEGTTCDPNPCQVPRGACCQPSGVCQPNMTQAECVNQTYPGTYAGDDTTCDPNPCPQPAFGACCFGTGGCAEVEDWQCSRGYGTFQGSGTSCCTNPCPQGQEPGWGDDFESYPVGTSLYHVGGWTGWNDDPAAAGTVSNVRAHAGVNALAVNDTSDAIHPLSYLGIQNGQWVVTFWQYLPSDLINVTYLTMQSYYEHNGSQFFTVELRFDATTGVVYDGLRDQNMQSTVPLVFDQWVQVRIEIDLDTSLGSIRQYYNGLLVKAGDWITGAVGQLAIANIDFYAPHGTIVYYDDVAVRPADATPMVPQRPLFVGVQYGNLPTRSTNLAGFPNVTWSNSFRMPSGEGVNGAAGRPDGSMYLTSGDFNTKLYMASYQGPAVYLTDLYYPSGSRGDVSGLAYGRGKLYGFSNSASPMGIYEVNPKTGVMTLVVDTSASGRRFFGLDYNATDGLLYGYDGYGSPGGLCSINIDTGVVTHVAASAPCEPRGLACGHNKVYAVPPNGAECAMYVYDLAQGPGGTWQSMTHPYPDSNSTSGAAFIPGPMPGDMNCDGVVNGLDIQPFVLAITNPSAYETTYLDCTICNADVNSDGVRNLLDVDALVQLLING